jgi:hypothetical protein
LRGKRSATGTAFKLATLYRVFRESIPDAEAFIARIAAQQLDGDEYRVLNEDGSTRPLAEWLTDALVEYRQGDGEEQEHTPDASE